MRIVYVLTSDCNDIFADMNLISLWSLRQSNPDAHISIIVDTLTMKNLVSKHHPILKESCDFIEISSSYDTPAFRNRYMKTQIRRYIDGSFLYLDADTITCKDLKSVFDIKSLVAGVPNHNGKGNCSEIPYTEKELLKKMGWEVCPYYYVNGGVLFMADHPDVHDFCSIWHKKWSESSQKTGMFNDQPALNQALYESSVEFSWLSHQYNAQVHARPCTAANAAIWHIYSSGKYGQPNNVLNDLIQKKRQGINVSQISLTDVCSKKHPWIVKNPIDQYAISKIQNSFGVVRFYNWEWLWLCGKHFDATKAAFRSILKKMFEIR